MAVYTKGKGWSRSPGVTTRSYGGSPTPTTTKTSTSTDTYYVKELGVTVDSSGKIIGKGNIKNSPDISVLTNRGATAITPLAQPSQTYFTIMAGKEVQGSYNPQTGVFTTNTGQQFSTGNVYTQVDKNAANKKFYTTGGVYVDTKTGGLTSRMQSPQQLGQPFPTEQKPQTPLEKAAEVLQPKTLGLVKLNTALATRIYQSSSTPSSLVKVGNVDTSLQDINKNVVLVRQDAEKQFFEGTKTSLDKAIQQQKEFERKQEKFGFVSEAREKAGTRLATLIENRSLSPKAPTNLFGQSYERGLEQANIAFNNKAFDIPIPGVNEAFRAFRGGAAFVGEASAEFYGLALEKKYVQAFKSPLIKIGAISLKQKPYATQEGANITYETGRLAIQTAPYFVSPGVAFAKSIVDIGASKSKKELAFNVGLGLVTAGSLKALSKVNQAATLAVSKATGGTVKVVKGVEGLVYSSRAASLLSKGIKIGGKYALPGTMGVIGVSSVPPILLTAASGDLERAREMDRELARSFGGVTIGGMAGSYIGTETGKLLQPYVMRESVMQSSQFTLKEKNLFMKAFEQSYGTKALPRDLSKYLKDYKVGEFKSKSLSILSEGGYVTNMEAKRISFATDKALQDFVAKGGEVKIIGSSVVPPQIKGQKPYKFFGDIDVAKGNKNLAEAIVKEINALKLKGITASTYGKVKEGFGQKYFVQLERNGLRMGSDLKNAGKIKELPEFINITKSLEATKGQYKIFGEPFGVLERSFLKTSGGKSNVKVFSIRDQLRAKIQGAYFGGRAKDVKDIEAILKGTKEYSIQFQDVKRSNVFLDERAMFKAGKGTKVKVDAKVSADFRISSENGISKEYGYLNPKSERVITVPLPKTNYSQTKEYRVSKVGGINNYYSSKQDSSYYIPNQDYSLSKYSKTNYVTEPSYVPKVTTSYKPSGYVSNVTVPYIPTGYTPITPTPYVPTPYIPKKYVPYKPTPIKPTTYIPTKYTPPKIPPTIYPNKIKSRLFDLTKKKKLLRGFSVFSRVRGKKIKLAGGVPFNLATGIGRKFTAETTARSFVVKPEGFTTRLDVAPINLNQYREPKIGRQVEREGFKFVEKSRFAIDTIGEIRGLKAGKLKRITL